MVAQLPRGFLRTGDQKRFLPEALLFGEAVAFGADFVPHLPWEGALHRYVCSVLSNVFSCAAITAIPLPLEPANPTLYVLSLLMRTGSDVDRTGVC